MTQKIKRKFFGSTSLPVLETEVNAFTDAFDPGNILDVQWMIGTLYMTQSTHEIKTIHPNPKLQSSENITDGTGTQCHVEKHYVMITYLIEEEEPSLSG